MFNSDEFDELGEYMAKIIMYGKTIFDSNDYMTIQDAINYLEKNNLKPKLNCPNCGALITSSKCEYCGTDFEQKMM